MGEHKYLLTIILFFFLISLPSVLSLSMVCPSSPQYTGVAMDFTVTHSGAEKVGVFYKDDEGNLIIEDAIGVRFRELKTQKSPALAEGNKFPNPCFENKKSFIPCHS